MKETLYALITAYEKGSKRKDVGECRERKTVVRVWDGGVRERKRKRKKGREGEKGRRRGCGRGGEV